MKNLPMRALQQDDEALEMCRKRRWFMRKLVARRQKKGAFRNIMAELEREKIGGYIGLLRMDPNMFRELLQRVGPRITKPMNRGNEPLAPALKLAITLCYYSTGNAYRALEFHWRVPHNTTSGIVRDVSEAIIAEYADELVVMPRTSAEWKNVAEQWSTRWNFHHMLGAIDGKHFPIRKPAKSGTVYHKYKGFFSIIMMAVVDANCKFLWTDVGANGMSSDGQVFNGSSLLRAVERHALDIPQPETRPNGTHNIISPFR